MGGGVCVCVFVPQQAGGIDQHKLNKILLRQMQSPHISRTWNPSEQRIEDELAVCPRSDEGCVLCCIRKKEMFIPSVWHS